MGKCNHSLCNRDAVFSASISENRTEWLGGHFCAEHSLEFVRDEPYQDVRMLAPMPKEAFDAA